MTRLKSLRNFLLIWGGVLGLDIISYILLIIVGVLSKNMIVSVSMAVGTLVLFGFFCYICYDYSSKKTLLNELLIENAYNLGRVSSFYNFHAMEIDIKKLRALVFKNTPAYCIAFSPSNAASNSAGGRNSVVQQLNGEIAQWFDKFFSTHGYRIQHNNIYCYYHGYFIIYSFMKNEFVDKFMTKLSTDLFKIAEENQIHVFVQPFFGVSEVTNPKENLLTSIENALAALNYSEKNFQEKTYFDEKLVKIATEDDIKEIQQAIEDKEFIVYYQPKYSLKTKEVVSSEALIRWNSPKYGFSGPDKFLSKAEEGGLMHDIDMYVFKRVCEDLSETKRRGRRLLPVSVNFSLYEFYAPNFLTELTEIIKQYELDPGLIEVEITEGTSQANSFLAISYLKKIKDQGLQILMDDFGTGYSNIANLCKLPIDKVKIDKSLVDNLVNDPKTRESVRYLINLCTVNGLESIAEGVDNVKQVEILRKLKCDTIQGYYYSRPISKEAYDNFLIENTFEKHEKKETRGGARR